ncbi:STAS domain-containing protein [Actinomadura sp. 21ATH]|uniref:STAS domain-containing protein n=1 Tax=Actinomadura sp. 21ATH TaxID=1735444 RepID=UPI0035C011F3
MPQGAVPAPVRSRTESAAGSAVTLEPWVVLRFGGELDCARAGSLRRAVDEVLAARERPRIALDLGEVSFCDSYGLSVLVHAAKKVRERGGALLLARVSRQVRMLIERCGLERLLVLP